MTEFWSKANRRAFDVCCTHARFTPRPTAPASAELHSQFALFSPPDCEMPHYLYKACPTNVMSKAPINIIWFVAKCNELSIKGISNAKRLFCLWNVITLINLIPHSKLHRDDFPFVHLYRHFLFIAATCMSTFWFIFDANSIWARALKLNLFVLEKRASRALEFPSVIYRFHYSPRQTAGVPVTPIEKRSVLLREAPVLVLSSKENYHLTNS